MTSGEPAVKLWGGRSSEFGGLEHGSARLTASVNIPKHTYTKRPFLNCSSMEKM